MKQSSVKETLQVELYHRNLKTKFIKINFCLLIVDLEMFCYRCKTVYEER